MTFVKICGITRLEDARAALDAGANAIGFIFWPKSARYIDPARARAIIASLPEPVLAIGVFVNQPSDEVNEAASRAGVNAVQLHGDETPGAAGAITRPVIKALAGAALSGATERWPRGTTILVDAHDPEQRGGTGQQADWKTAAQLARTRRVLLAGGLTPENVAQAIAEVRPYGIDVSSGVEAAPGIKALDKLTALFKALEAVNR